MEEHRDPKEELHPNEEPQEDSDSSEYSFMQERIKLDRRGIRKGLFKMAGFGLVFGIFACFSFTKAIEASGAAPIKFSLSIREPAAIAATLVPCPLGSAPGSSLCPSQSIWSICCEV